MIRSVSFGITLLAGLATTASAQETLPTDLAELITAGLAEAVEEHRSTDAAYGIAQAQPRVVVPTEGGLTLTWKTPGGQTATTSAQVIGDFSPQHNAFAWAWANQSVPEPLSALSRQIRDHGNAHAMPLLGQPSFTANLGFAQKLSSVATLFDGIEGIYALERGPVVMFFAYGTVALEDPQ